MLIGGGVYVETCVTPARQALFGSGGRAAMVLAGLGAEVVLHTFQPVSLWDDVEVNFSPFGVHVVAHPSPHRFTFDYLHPMSRPRVTPLPRAASNTVAIEGEGVLRFGCLEGDFRVTAARAVYDPQSGAEPVPFRANGSAAESLALVLNANELRRMAGMDDLGSAAAHVMEAETASVLVVKDGSAGAYVFGEAESPWHVPAYPTESVYKIGSGDVFSAAFAQAWMYDRVSAAEAADLASRRTAQYVETPAFPLVHEIRPTAAGLAEATRRRVLLAFEARTSSQRWVLNESIRGLRDLGATVVTGEDCPFGKPGALAASIDVVLLHADDRRTVGAALDMALAHGKPVIVFADDPSALIVARDRRVPATSDLCSALYRTQWVSL